MSIGLIPSALVLVVAATVGASGLDLEGIRQRAEHYDQRYAVRGPLEKEVDNRGEGDERLYGTRNFRVVLRGVLYRGGANNAYHRGGPRRNSNPLPADGVENLCREGFATSIYLYESNFSTAPNRVQCRSRLDGGANLLTYRQLTALEERELRQIHALVRETILEPSRGPVYAHCWNGWHASGLVAATSLVQFCGVSNAAALDYWTRGTDGQQSGYDHVRARIRQFRPDPALTIPRVVAAVICPDMAPPRM